VTDTSKLSDVKNMESTIQHEYTRKFCVHSFANLMLLIFSNICIACRITAGLLYVSRSVFIHTILEYSPLDIILAYQVLIPLAIKIFIIKLQNNHDFQFTIHIFTITQLKEMPHSNT
jgi:hypothetical protein